MSLRTLNFAFENPVFWGHCIATRQPFYLSLWFSVPLHGDAISQNIFYFSFFNFFKILFIFKEKGREGERRGGKHQCVVASSAPPTGNMVCNQAHALTASYILNHLLTHPPIHPSIHAPTHPSIQENSY